MLMLVAQSCPTLCNPMDCSLPDSSVHGSDSLSCVRLFAIPGNAACQASLSTRIL